MAVSFSNKIIFTDSDGYILRDLIGDILCCSSYYTIDHSTLNLSNIINLFKSSLAYPVVRLSVLNPDETVDYVIPAEDVVLNSVKYNEKYTNRQRRDLQFTLINDRQNGEYKYIPSVNGLWYGSKIKYEQGIKYADNEYYFVKGIYIIKNFDMQYSTEARDITYQCTDKFGMFEGPTGTLIDGYEIPVGTPIDEAIDDLLNLSNTDGYITDYKACIIDSRYIDFVTQSTIRVDAGGTIGDVIEQLATQLSAEYYYNAAGYLFLYPMNESMNDVNKSVIWDYNEIDMDNLSFAGSEEVINVVNVVGTNVDGKIYSAVVKNTNLQSPINIYHIKERKMPTINSANIWSDEMAQELAEFNLRQKTILTVQQSYTVPYNPLLMVNNIIEVDNEDLNMDRQRFIINGISYSSGDATMSIEIANITHMSLIGGINYNGQ